MPFSFFFSELFKWSFSNLMNAWPRLGRQVVRLLVLIMAQSSGLQCLGIRHIDYILTESLPDEKSFVFESPYKSGHFGCALFTDITVEKLSRIILHRFDKKKYGKIVFRKRLSGLPWLKVYQCSTPSECLSICCLLLWKPLLPIKSLPKEVNIETSERNLVRSWMQKCAC